MLNISIFTNLMSMKLTTNRLNLTPISSTDSLWFHELNINPQVRKYLWDDEVISESLANDIINESIRLFNENQWGLWKIDSAKNQIGYAGLWNFFDEPQPQLLYVIDPKHTRNGYAKEASQSVIKHTFEKLKFNYLIASMDEANIASIKVCESLNMSKKETKKIDGSPIVFYQIDNPTY